MLYTRKGDNGTTKLFDCPQGVRVSKSSFIFEALGLVDELNSSVGYAKVLARNADLKLLMNTGKVSYEQLLSMFQQVLFCIQAELGGSDIHPTNEHILFLEEVIYDVDTIIPPITSFIIPGGGDVGAYLDIVRTLARKVERVLVSIRDRGERMVCDESITYLNRLSSALYALARFSNYQAGYIEQKPMYR